ncbi:unnamed protein product [Periconia digitata]|uniref:Uncharacterized protein n=1 Tax=Periconia digitata TaxID=1303443 RepID=A0A9W4XPS9_9PLEO|nr:unnamed protein product [Periconia digitata]
MLHIDNRGQKIWSTRHRPLSYSLSILLTTIRTAAYPALARAVRYQTSCTGRLAIVLDRIRTCTIRSYELTLIITYRYILIFFPAPAYIHNIFACLTTLQPPSCITQIFILLLDTRNARMGMDGCRLRLNSAKTTRSRTPTHSLVGVEKKRHAKDPVLGKRVNGSCRLDDQNRTTQLRLRLRLLSTLP